MESDYGLVTSATYSAFINASAFDTDDTINYAVNDSLRISLYSGNNLISVWSADQVIQRIQEKIESRFHDIITVTDEVISSLKMTLNYNGTYIAYLLNQISADEFNVAAERYAVTLSSEETDEMRNKIKILFQISHENFSPSDIANLFHIEEHIAENVLNNLKDIGFLSDQDIS